MKAENFREEAYVAEFCGLLCAEAREGGSCVEVMPDTEAAEAAAGTAHDEEPAPGSRLREEGGGLYALKEAGALHDVASSREADTTTLARFKRLRHGLNLACKLGGNFLKLVGDTLAKDDPQVVEAEILKIFARYEDHGHTAQPVFNDRTPMIFANFQQGCVADSASVRECQKKVVEYAIGGIGGGPFSPSSSSISWTNSGPSCSCFFSSSKSFLSSSSDIPGMRPVHHIFAGGCAGPCACPPPDAEAEPDPAPEIPEIFDSSC
eukprot:g19902.t1